MLGTSRHGERIPGFLIGTAYCGLVAVLLWVAACRTEASPDVPPLLPADRPVWLETFRGVQWVKVDRRQFYNVTREQQARLRQPGFRYGTVFGATPDQKIVYSTFDDRTSRRIFRLYLHSVATGHERAIGPGYHPLPSPDGKWILYLNDQDQDPLSGRHVVHLYATDTGEDRVLGWLRELDPGSGVSFLLEWSEDGRGFRIAGSLYGRSQVNWVYDIAHGQAGDLAADGQSASQPGGQ